MPSPYDWDADDDLRSSRARRRDDRIRWVLLGLALAVFGVAVAVIVTGAA